MISEEPYESMYGLFLLQSLIADSSEKDVAELRSELPSEERMKLRMCMIKENGIKWMIENIGKVKEGLRRDEIVGYTRMIMNLITVYITAALKSNSKFAKDYKHFSYQLIKEEQKTDSTSTTTSKPKLSTISILLLK